jgi:hypothetical protein
VVDRELWDGRLRASRPGALRRRRWTNAATDHALRAAADGASVGEFWIGLFDLDQANRWLRSDLVLAWTGTASGTPDGYTHFGSGAPSGTGGQDCAAVTASGTWADRDCGVLKAYACEEL